MTMQAYTPANPLSDERICKATPSGRCPPREVVSRNSGPQPSPSASLVPEPVSLLLSLGISGKVNERRPFLTNIAGVPRSSA